ncbi:MAG TPA: hypothetical protein DCX60_02635 [Phycisphaerales bacterium]|nr:hypothetical protein [Phycisphaerales bacterium]
MIAALTLILYFFLAAVVVGVSLLLLFKGTVLLVHIIARIVNFVFGVIADIIIIILNLLGIPFAAFFAVVLLILGRWKGANGQARLLGDRVLRVCMLKISIVVIRPLRLFFLDDAANSISERLPSELPDGPMILDTGPVSGTPARHDSSIQDKRISEEFFPEAFSNFTIIGQLPSGGSGARLFVAYPRKRRGSSGKRLPETVVIKSFTLQDGSNLPSIVRESRALESASRIGLVLEHHLEDERFWYVMPYHAGPTLTQAVQMIHDDSRHDGRLNDAALPELIQFVRDLLETLDHFHRSGLWHKDVKPDNLIVHDDRTHLVDLGLMSSLSSSLTLTTHGTEYFRDPELVRMALRGVKVHEIDGAKFDIFGAGAVLYFVLANDFPAQGGLSRFKYEVPPALDWIVRRAMADYDKRYAVVAEMLADLEAFADAEDPWAMVPADLPSLGGRPVSMPPPRASFRPELASIAMPKPPPSKSPVPPPPPVISSRQASRRSRLDVPSDRPTGMLLALGGVVVVMVAFFVGSWILLGPSKNAVSPEFHDGSPGYPGKHLAWVNGDSARFGVNDDEEVVFLPLHPIEGASDLPQILIGWHTEDISEDPLMSERLDALLDDYLLMGYAERLNRSQYEKWNQAVMNADRIVVLPFEESDEARLIRENLSLEFDGPFSPQLVGMMDELGIGELIFLTGGDEIAIFDRDDMVSHSDVPLVENMSQ